MKRIACVHVPALPLQVLFARRPGWRALPCVVVDADEATGTVLWGNAPAWNAAVRPGQRYASALALEANLRAATVEGGEVRRAVDSITTLLRERSPLVECSRAEPGLFWLDADGLARLHPDLKAWARGIAHALHAAGWDASVVLGCTRIGSGVLAKSLHRGRALPPRMPAAPRPVLACLDAVEERQRVREVPLALLVATTGNEAGSAAGNAVLGLAAEATAALARLGIRTLGGFLDLPADGVQRRFGAAAASLHALARGRRLDVLEASPEEEALRRSALLDDPVGDSGILLFLLGRLLRPLLGVLAARGQGVGQLQARLHQDLARRRPSLELEARPATPTLDEALLADLLRLRLEASRQGEARAASYVEAEVGVQGVPIAASQLRVFREHAGRDLGAAARAMARVAAEFGPGAVVRAVLRQAHLPEASFAWEPLQALPAAQPRTPSRRVLVRRVPLRPLPLAQRPFRERDDGWMVPASGDDASREASHARVDSITAADVVSGGWWNREVHREYHYAVTSDGEVLWVYRDLARGRWFLAGKVE